MNTKVLLAVVVIAFAVCMVTAKSRAPFHLYDKVSFFYYLYFFLTKEFAFKLVMSGGILSRNGTD